MKKKSIKKKKTEKNKHYFLKDYSIKKTFSEIKIHIIVALLIFIFFIGLGYISILVFPSELTTPIEKALNNLIRDLIEKTEGLSAQELISFIFWNNSKSAFFGLIFGIFLAIVPIMILTVNGFLLGYVIYKTTLIKGTTIIWRLFPHGIFEIPAIIIATALGIKIGVDLMINTFKHFDKNLPNKTIYGLILLSMIFFWISFPIIFIYTLYYKELRIKFYNNLTKSLLVFFLFIIPLLIIAAIIEGLLINLI